MNDDLSPAADPTIQLRNIVERGLQDMTPGTFLQLSAAPLPATLTPAQCVRIGVLRIITLRQTLQLQAARDEVTALAPTLGHALPDDLFMYHCEATRVNLITGQDENAIRHLMQAYTARPGVIPELQDYLYMVLAVMYASLQDYQQQLLHTRLAARTLPPGHPYHSVWNEHVRRANLSWVLGTTGYTQEALKLGQWAISGLQRDYPHSGTIRQVRTESFVFAAQLGLLSPDNPDLQAARAELQGQVHHPLNIPVSLTDALLAMQRGDHTATRAAFNQALSTVRHLRDHGTIAALTQECALNFYRSIADQDSIIEVLQERVTSLEERRKRTSSILQHLAESAADLIQLRQELTFSRHELVERLSAIGEGRDDHTGQHTRRVAHLTYRIACILHLPDASDIATASRLHDLGKVSLPDRILLKPGPLTPEERQEMQRHAEIGASMLSGGNSNILQLAQTIARHHHERWDGSGYPDRLQGHNIPLAARITAVADVFDALTSERPYKPAWTRQDALQEILTQSGRQFDPEVVNALAHLLHENRDLDLEGIDLAALQREMQHDSPLP